MPIKNSPKVTEINAADFTSPDGKVDYAAMAKAFGGATVLPAYIAKGSRSPAEAEAHIRKTYGERVKTVVSTVLESMRPESGQVKVLVSMLAEGIFTSMFSDVPNGDRGAVKDLIVRTIQPNPGGKGRAGGLVLKSRALIAQEAAPMATHKRGK